MTSHSDAIKQFRHTHRGDVITPDDARYDQARRVWNAMIDKRPALIARPRNAADVTAAVTFARANHLPIAVRGGAHSIAGRATCDDGMVIDFADMKAIKVDPVAKTAIAEPGLKWQDFDRETQAFGLATTGGTVGDTGIAGLTLGGGFGWLEGKFGMTVDNLIGADVVLASGKLVRASEHENPDLFWALRGGGGNFGIVTSFKYRLHDVGPTIVGGLVVHPFPRATEALRFYNEFMRTAPDELVAAAVLMTGPDGNKACGIAVAYMGDVAEGERIVAPIKAVRPARARRDRADAIPVAAESARAGHASEPAELLEGGIHPRAVRRCDRPRGRRLYSRALADLVHPVLSDPRRASRVAPDATAFPHRSGYHLGSTRCGTTQPRMLRTLPGS